ncbi:DUF2937 family protein [Shewanella sp. SR44-3]|uniref:DUF2937 family protein n=1 Tax=unclassified Shewanella TaxID=196818 RepID=UPI0015F952CD|nr:DUF2937 family protein [Shewanella sp. SR44-3]MBB1269381.1 DUF2937 family protein [Shewanella sp. SR44-3]
MIKNVIDKLVFGIALIFALQLPLLADHYQQYLSGLYQATKWQVDGYEMTAKMHEFPDARAMIARHLQLNEPSVNTDAKQKLVTLELFDELSLGMDTFNRGNLFEQLVFMFNPKRYDALIETSKNFTLGIPLDPVGLGFGVILGLLLNGLIMLPATLLFSKRKS